eukprot:TRINITY_DN13310_c0_g1_i1.p1 TRINITY_DN13310_c0_g1~~TRINITY_DN13310_c0_g1_i1.p1  ORF type:complete len:198 (+),score=67.76 TRINITY_DN13310_c0_g1_i1:75-668(+)
MEGQCELLMSKLRQSAPVFRPNIVPKGFKISSLEELIGSADKKEELRQTVLQQRLRCKSCTVCMATVPLEELKFEVGWDLQFSEHTMKLSKGYFLCADCQLLLNLNKAINLTTVQKAESGELLQRLASKFFQINFPGPGATFPASITYFEQCYSLAYSLQIFSSKLPDIELLDSRGESLEEALDQNPSRVISLLFPL